jgi:mono/diheme cytochrome c family protein
MRARTTLTLGGLTWLILAPPVAVPRGGVGQPTAPSGASAVTAQAPTAAADTAALAAALGVRFVQGSNSSLMLEQKGKTYLVDLAARTIREVDPPLPAPAISGPIERVQAVATRQAAQNVRGQAVFKDKCASCHGADGRGIKSIGTPNFTDPQVQASLTDQQILDTIHNGKKGTMMTGWAGKLSEEDIAAVAQYIRSLSAPGAQASPPEAPKIYEPGDDYIFSLPTGRRLDRHGFYVNFSHRFAFDPAFTGTARGGALLGLDGFSLSSFGFRYGVTDKLSVSIYRAPTFIARPIELMAAYNLLDEHDGHPLNAVFRVSIAGQNNFSRNYTENFEGIFSRSITPRAQFYVVPTLSINNRRLFSPSGFGSADIPNLPGHNDFALGGALSVDVRPTVALFAEIDPMLAGGRALGVHRPAWGFGIQKKIWRHAFTLGFTNSPGVEVAQRAGTRAAFLNDPAADKPGGLVIGFDLSRQIH